jgi:hypothetical protein
MSRNKSGLLINSGMGSNLFVRKKIFQKQLHHLLTCKMLSTPVTKFKIQHSLIHRLETEQEITKKIKSI